MITLDELNEAIRECESSPANYNVCAKLATLYTVRYYLYGIKEGNSEENTYSFARDGNYTVGDYGDSDFLQMIKGKAGERVWAVMDELMSTLLLTNPRLYDGVMRRLEK